MPTDHRAVLAKIKRFDQLIAYLRDEVGWPIARDSFEDVDDLFYDFTADELGIDPKTAAKIESIKRLRPLSPRQRWGIFFVKFEPKKLPVVALRRILSQVALKKRASANNAERTAWAADDLLFVSNYGEGDERQISFAHFSQDRTKADLPILKVLGWNDRDTALRLDGVATELATKLSWPEDESDVERWREKWRSAFTLRPDEVIKTSKALAVELAKLARKIRDRIRTVLAIETENGPVTKLMKAFQEALVHDLDADGFADMYAQTIAYGLLSARVTNPKANTADGFAAQLPVTNPFLKELMETFLHIGGRKGKAGRGPGIDFDELGVSEVVELLDDANMEAVVRDFGDKNPQEDPVIHFYELFLKEYDAKKRMQRGVFYTPRPVVSYIVRSVHELLQTEFGLPDGLADTAIWGEMARRHKDLAIPEGVSPDQAFVQLLDPATGTGTFLVEVIDLIHKTLVAKWKAQGHGEKKIDSLWNEYVPKHLLPRLHGYELLMAPYAIAHLKIGLKLYETGYRFGSDERARIYLTNALEPAHDFSGTFEFAIPALAHEAQAVNEIKRKQRFTVLIGNPPYSINSCNLQESAVALVEPFRYVDGEKIQERGALKFETILQDDYVKFWGLGIRILEKTPSGIISMISNNGFMTNRVLRGVRKTLLNNFNRLASFDLHGNRSKGEVCPDGSPDDNVFDINQGVGISILRKTAARPSTRKVELADLWGSRGSKYQTLGNSTASKTAFQEHFPKVPYYAFALVDGGIEDEYRSFVALDEAMPFNKAGFVSGRDDFAVDFDVEPLEQRISEFLNPKNSESAVRERYSIKDAGGYELAKRRQTALASKLKAKDIIRRVQHRPFDYRVVAYSEAVLTSPQKAAMRQLIAGDNVAFCLSRGAEIIRGWEHIICTRAIVQHHTVSLKEVNYVFPLNVSLEDGSLAFGTATSPNFAAQFLKAIASRLKLGEDSAPGLPAGLTPEDIFHYAYAVFHSPGYRSRYSEFLKIDFPRLPLPGGLDLFRDLGRLGGELVALHLMESPKLDHSITTYTGPKNPEVGRVGWSDDTVWLDAAATKKGQPATPGTIGFRGVPETVWNFHIGGYQVCEKWLKDRKDRTLTADDIAHYHRIVIALHETIRLMRDIDEVIAAHGGWPGAFQTADAKKEAAIVVPFKPRIVPPRREDRYVTSVPLVPLKIAAGAFGDPQHVEDDNWEWVAIETKHRLRPGMFVAQVVGKSMEPAIPDGSYCLFAAPVTGTRQGKTVLVQLRDATDPETGERYTVKRYESEKTPAEGSWRHAKITLKPVNPDFQPIVHTGAEEGQVQVIAELVEVLR